MFEKLFSYRQIASLERKRNLFAATTNDRSRRSQVPIAIIDDEPFAAQQTLTNHGYDVRPIGDIKSLSEIDPYNIILCDLRGVGKNFDKKHQGAYLIDEIKRNHPEKFVVAYTGGALNDEMGQMANRAADSFIKKDAEIEEWRNKLDDLIDRICDPVIVWRRQRDALVKQNVSTLDIIKLEDAFVKAVEIRKPAIFQQKARSIEIGGDARAIAQSLIGSGIMLLLTGS